MVTNALRHRYLSSIWIKPHRARCPLHKWQPIINYAAFSVVQMTKSSHTRHLMRIPKGWLLRQIYDTTVKIQLKVEHFSYPTSMQQPPITQIAFRIHVFLQTHQNQYPPGPGLRCWRVFCTPEETPLRQWAVALGPAKRFTENIMICISSTGGEPSNGWQFYIAMLLKEEKNKVEAIPNGPGGMCDDDCWCISRMKTSRSLCGRRLIWAVREQETWCLRRQATYAESKELWILNERFGCLQQRSGAEPKGGHFVSNSMCHFLGCPKQFSHYVLWSSDADLKANRDGKEIARFCTHMWQSWWFLTVWISGFQLEVTPERGT